METPTKTALALATQAGDRTAFGLYRREAGTDVSQLFGLLVRIGTLRCFAGLSLAFQSPTFQGNPETVVGSIRVLYDPNRPAEAKIRSFEGLWLISGLVMVLGAGFSLLFTGLFVSVLR